MIDIWLEIALTLVVAVATVIADWVAHLLITSTMRLSAISKVVDQAIADEDKLVEIEAEVRRFYEARSESLAWGSDLAAIAFSLDLIILAIWIVRPALFPFFSQWNSAGVSREIPVWLILIFVHFIMLLVSIAFRHFHAERIGSAVSAANFPSKGWLSSNVFMLASNVLGFATLLSSFLIASNSI